MAVTMAIDGSTKSTGIAIFDGQELVHYECVTSSKSDTLARIKLMAAKIKENHIKYNVNNVIMEDVIPEDVHHNDNVYTSLKYLQAAVVLTLHDLNQAVEFYVSSEWRKKCGIRTGRGIKRETVKASDIAFVKSNYNLDVNDDIADAICIGWAYTHDAPIEAPADPSGFDFR